MSNRAEALIHQARSQPDKVALLFEGESWTYARLLHDVRSYARVLPGPVCAGSRSWG